MGGIREAWRELGEIREVEREGEIIRMHSIYEIIKQKINENEKIRCKYVDRHMKSYLNAL